MKVPGVLGGLGPQTTADYYLRVQQLVQERNLPARPPMLTWSVPLPYDLENESIFDGTGFEEIGTYLIEGARRLERAGADFVVMPCNSLHICAGQIIESIKIPFVSIVDESVRYVDDHSFHNLALLATQQTVERGLYTNPLREAGVNVLLPSYEQQRGLNESVVRLINGKQTEIDAIGFQAVLDSLVDRGAELVLLACTDFHILFNEECVIPHIDTMEVLAQTTVRLMNS